jgi:glycosyltransferase involved in cell wall biosynthesis
LSIAVIIASFNREQLAYGTARSLLRSRINNVIIVDDGSKCPYQDQVAHPGITVVRLPVNGGPSSARNIGAKSTDAEWLIFLDDDDSLDTKAIEWIKAQETVILKDFDLVHFGFKKIDQNTKTLSVVTLSSEKNPTTLSGSWMIRRDFFLNIEGYEERLRYSENTELIERATERGARVLHAGFSSLCYTVGRPQRREEVAPRRTEAAIFYLRFRPHCDRIKMLKIGLVNSWWSKNFVSATRVMLAYTIPGVRNK